MIYVGCSTQVKYLGLTNEATGTTVNNATVVATLLDGDGDEIYSTTFTPSGSGGNYSATIPASVTQGLEPGGTYTLNVVSSVSGSQIDERNETIQVSYRGLYE